MCPLRLSDSPKEKEFEEFISAYLHLAGHYVERNITQRESADVLELDIITTNYDKTSPDIQLIEIKSGKNWGFPDIFKIRGWMDYLSEEGYLDVAQSAFIAQREIEQKRLNLIVRVGKSLGIDIIILSDYNEFGDKLSILNKNTSTNNEDIRTWRYSYWVERKLIDDLKNYKKNNPEKKCYDALNYYLFENTSGFFFIENIIEKIIRLYETYQKYPHISAKCGNECEGNDFDEECQLIPKNIFKKTFYHCEYTDVQLSTYFEHRARLSILKSAIDLLIYRDLGIKRKSESKTLLSIKLGEYTYELDSYESLPNSFKKGLEEISKHEYYRRYPVFWQWFMWVFGGIILKDYEDKEYEYLSHKTGIPVDEIPNAFKSYQLLFPLDEGWFRDLSNSNIRVLKLFPVPFMGVGAHHRRCIYLESETSDFDDLQVTGVNTKRDLIKWNNFTYNLLKNNLYLNEPPPSARDDPY